MTNIKKRDGNIIRKNSESNEIFKQDLRGEPFDDLHHQVINDSINRDDDPNFSYPSDRSPPPTGGAVASRKKKIN